ncbi:hypothetical protein [Kribbella sp. DT2]|uniref:hypothetical protein n=1 Tax=Kribbella sp. DT2 TaxID=3393427 RepID=UPI003CF3975D
MSAPTTPDGHHIVVNGRKWRATDPAIPDELRDELQRSLMAARRAIAQSHRDDDPEAEREARARVQIAKVALGERGDPWWEQSDQERELRWTDGLQKLGTTGDRD